MPGVASGPVDVVEGKADLGAGLVDGLALDEASSGRELIAARLEDPDSTVRDVSIVLFDQGAYAVHARVASARATSSKTSESL